MLTLTRRFALIAITALVGVGLFAASAQAQFRRPAPIRVFPSVQSVYPTFVPSRLQQDAFRNWAFNSRVIARTYRQFPPWYFGYNPYPQVVNYGPVYRYPTYPIYPVPYPYPSGYYPTPLPAYDSGYLATPNPYGTPFGVYP
jgi:hypothetical protein